MTRFKEIYLS